METTNLTQDEINRGTELLFNYLYSHVPFPENIDDRGLMKSFDFCKLGLLKSLERDFNIVSKMSEDDFCKKILNRE